MHRRCILRREDEVKEVMYKKPGSEGGLPHGGNDAHVSEDTPHPRVPIGQPRNEAVEPRRLIEGVERTDLEVIPLHLEDNYNRVEGEPGGDDYTERRKGVQSLSLHFHVDAADIRRPLPISD